MKQTITIVTVVRNGETYIEDTLQSIISQTYPNIELIVIDGASSDKTLEILKNYSTHITKIISEPDKGIYDAMNKGIKTATGEWIIFMNGGDRFYNENVLTNLFETDRKDSDILYGDTLLDISEFNITSIYKPYPMKYFYKGPLASHQSILVRTRLAKEKLFDLSYSMAADYDFLFWAHMNKLRFLYIPLIISKYLIKPSLKQSYIRCYIEYWKINRNYKKNIFVDFYYLLRILIGITKKIVVIARNRVKKK